MDYLAQYERGLPYFDSDLSTLCSAIEKKQCVVLCSAYKMGDRRFLDYLYHHISHEDHLDVYYDKENLFTASTLEKIQEKTTTRTKVVLLPWYFRKPTTFTRAFLQLMRDRRATFISVIIMEPSFFDAPEKFFPDTNLPMQVVLARKPLDKENTLSLLHIRENLADTHIAPETLSQVYALSGGHIGLTKRLFTLATQGERLKLPALLFDPALRATLLNLELQYRTLSKETCKKIGLLTQEEGIAIPLLRAFVQSITEELSDTLTPLQQKLLELFLSRNGELVTKEEVHEIMDPEREYSLWAVYKSIARFSKAVEKQYVVKNVSGKGYVLVKRNPDAPLF